MGTKWRGLLAPLGTSTGDGRRFRADGVTHRELPLPLKWQRSDNPAHDDSVVVGRMDSIDITADAVWGEGEMFDDADPETMPRLAEDVAEAMHLLGNKVIGPSVDPGAAEAVLAEVGSDEPIDEDRLEELLEEAFETGEDPPIEVLFTQYEIAAATLVTVPAFAECRPFELLTDEARAALVAAVRGSGWADMPLAARDHAWDGDGAAGRLADMCALDSEDDADWGCYAAGFLYRDDAADAQTRGAYGFGIADVLDGTLSVVPRGVFAAAAALQGARGGTTIPEADQEAMRTVLNGIYARMAEEFDDDSIVPPWQDGAAEGAASMAALVAAAAPYGPPEAFEDPHLTTLTPITITDPDENGVRRVFGHIAAFGTCHTGFRNMCVSPPMSARGYADFHRYLTTASGAELPAPAGRITVAHGALTGRCTCCPGIGDHACNRMSMGQAIAHYDAAATVAYVRAGDDELAIWVAGVIAPEATDADVAALGRQKVSGDWRDNGGSLELVEVLTLGGENPGFPLPRTAMRHGRQVALVAAGAVTPRTAQATPPPAAPAVTLADVDYAALGRQVAAVLTAGTQRIAEALAVPRAARADTTTTSATPAEPTAAAAPAPAGPLVDQAALGAAVARELMAEVEQVDDEARAQTAAGLMQQIEEVAHV